MTGSAAQRGSAAAGFPAWTHRLGAAIPWIALGLLALAGPWFRHPDGDWAADAATLLGFAAAAATGLAGRRLAPQASGFLAAAMAAHAAALALRESPPYNVLERFPAWAELAADPGGWLLLVPLLQSVMIAGALLSVRQRLRPTIASLATPGWLLAFAGLVVITAANPSWDPRRWAAETTLAGWLALASLANLAVFAAALPPGLLDRVGEWGRGFLSHSRWWPMAAAAGLSAALSVAVFDRLPHIPDDISYLFQARTFAGGRLSVPAPPDPDAFVVGQTLVDGDRWYAYGSPGWPALLAAGVRLGVPWLVNPLVTGLGLLAAAALLRRLYDHRTAALAVLLLAASPWLLFMGGTFLTHPFGLLLLTLALLAVERARERGLVSAAAGGACFGALFLTRPLDALAAAPPLAAWMLARRRRRLGPASCAAFAAAAIAVGGLALPYNAALTGDPLTFPIDRWFDRDWYPGANRLGFGPDVGNVGWPHLDPLPGHGPLDALLNADLNAYMVNFELFGWGFGSLALALVGALAARRRADLLMLGLIGSHAVAYSLYWFSGGPDVGARYWYPMVLPLAALTARGLDAVRERRLARGGDPRDGARLGSFVAAASLIALLTVLPWRAAGKYHDYRGIDGRIGELVARADFGRSLVFVRQRDAADYPAAFLFNPPHLDGDGPIFARDLGPARRERLRHAFPDRPAWIVEAPAGPGDRFTVAAGPMPPSGAAERPAP